MLVAFDFDGTLSDSEMTVLLGERCGVADERSESAARRGAERTDGVTASDASGGSPGERSEPGGVADEMAAITERAMNDEIDYATSLRERAALLSGLSEASAREAYAQVELRPGAAAVVDALREAGHAVAVLTGGFETGVETALDAAGTAVDVVVANRLPVANGELTGEVTGPLVEGTKDDALETLASREGLPLADTVAVGDGANDLPMLEAAGLAVGFDPKPAVEPRCDVVVASMDELFAVFEERGLLPGDE